MCIIINAGGGVKIVIKKPSMVPSTCFQQWLGVLLVLESSSPRVVSIVVEFLRS